MDTYINEREAVNWKDNKERLEGIKGRRKRNAVSISKTNKQISDRQIDR